MTTNFMTNITAKDLKFVSDFMEEHKINEGRGLSYLFTLLISEYKLKEANKK